MAHAAASLAVEPGTVASLMLSKNHSRPASSSHPCSSRISRVVSTSGRLSPVFRSVLTLRSASRPRPRKRFSSLLALLCTVVVSGLAGLSTQGLCLRLRKISLATPDPDLPEVHSEQVEMDDPVVPPGASAVRMPSGQTGSPREGLLLRVEKALTYSDSYGFRSASGSELHKDVRDVPLGGAPRNVQRGGQLFRCVSCRDVAKDFPLAG